MFSANRDNLFPDNIARDDYIHIILIKNKKFMFIIFCITLFAIINAVNIK